MSEVLKRASWLELFYDLAFVALIAQLTYLAADHHSTLPDVFNIFLIGYMIFLAWFGTTANRNLQNSEDTVDKLMIQLQMAGAFLMSVSMPDVFAGDVTRFFATFAIVRGIQILMVLRLFRMYPDDAPQTNNILQGISIAAGLWFLVGFVPYPYYFVVAGMALLLDIFTSQTKGKGNKVRLLNINHLQERLGLFLLLVIGESMLVVALANTTASGYVELPIMVLSGLILMIALWWVYFVYLERCGEGVRPKNLFIYLHAHGFLFGSVVLLAAGYKNVLKHGEPTINDLMLLGLGFVGVVFTITLIRKALNGLTKGLVAGSIIALLLSFIILTLGLIAGFRLESIIALTLLAVLVTIVDQKKTAACQLKWPAVDREKFQ